MTNVFSYQGGSKSNAYVWEKGSWEMDPPEHIHGHLFGGPFPTGVHFPFTVRTFELYVVCMIIHKV